MNDRLTITKPDSGPFKGRYVVITLSEEVLESFSTAAEAEAYLFDPIEEAALRAEDEFAREVESRAQEQDRERNQ